jgi:hypothetical protein
LHPVRLDGALQALLGLLAESGGADGFVPVRFGRLVARRGGAAAVAATMELLDPGQRRATARGVLCDALGQAVAVLEAAEFQRLPRGARADAALAFRTDWVPAPLPAAWPGARRSTSPGSTRRPSRPPGWRTPRCCWRRRSSPPRGMPGWTRPRARWPSAARHPSDARCPARLRRDLAAGA